MSWAKEGVKNGEVDPNGINSLPTRSNGDASTNNVGTAGSDSRVGECPDLVV